MHEPSAEAQRHSALYGRSPSLPPQLSKGYPRGNTWRRVMQSSQKTPAAHSWHLAYTCRQSVAILATPCYLPYDMHFTIVTASSQSKSGHSRLVTHLSQCWTVKDMVNFVAQLSIVAQNAESQFARDIPPAPNILRQVTAAHSESECSLHTSVCKSRLEIVL